MKKLNVYVDGFNLYFGLMDAGYKDCKWLNIHALVNRIKNHNHLIQNIYYFTSRLNHDINKMARQDVYIRALLTTDVTIKYGQFRSESVHCKTCGNKFYDPKEKMTDVNIATQILIDAYTDKFDVAILISGDSDLVPPLKTVRELFPQKEVIIAFPPERDSNELKKNANSSFKIGHKKLQESLFDSTVTDKYGGNLVKPKEWI